jgi:hypothetical protein
VYTKDKNKECKVDHIKRQKILNLSSEDVNKFCNRTVIAIKRALCFLQLRCGVVKSTDVQYSLMLVVIAYYLDDDSVWGDSNKQSIIEYWYWCALLGGAYASRQNERCIDDILQLEKMLSGDKLAYSKWESSVLNYQDYATKDILLRRDSDNDREQGSVKNAILQFLISRCPEDFIINSTGDSDYICSWKIAQEDIIVELHHVIPLGTETKISESTSYLRKNKSHILNSCLNFAYITKKSNRMISDNSPTEYLKLVETGSISNHFLPSISAFNKAIETGDYNDVLERRWELINTTVNNHITHLKISF